MARSRSGTDGIGTGGAPIRATLNVPANSADSRATISAPTPAKLLPSSATMRHPVAATDAIIGAMSSGCREVGTTTSASRRSEEHTSELQSLMRISYAVFCLKKKTNKLKANTTTKTRHIKSTREITYKH